MGLDLQPDLCSLLIDGVIYARRCEAGRGRKPSPGGGPLPAAGEVMGRLMEICQRLYVSRPGTVVWACKGGLDPDPSLQPNPNRSHPVWLRVQCLIPLHRVTGWPTGPEEALQCIDHLFVAAAAPVLDALGRVISNLLQTSGKPDEAAVAALKRFWMCD